MHPQYYSIQFFIDFFGKPTHSFWKQSFLLKVTLSRLKYYIITASYLVPFSLQSNCKLVHYTTTYRDKMNFHDYIRKISSKINRLIKTNLHYEKQINCF